MLTQTLIRMHRLVLLVSLTVALVATGFGHRMPAPSDAALAFALANGATAADFCGDDLDGDGVRDPHCLACQIAGTADLPTTTQSLIDLDLAFVARTVARAKVGRWHVSWTWPTRLRVRPSPDRRR